jgi:hypothetical protein
MAATCVKLKRGIKVRPSTIAGINIAEMDDAIFTAALAIVRPIYKAHGESDKAAKGSEFVTKLKEAISAKYPITSTSKKSKKKTT